MLKSNYLTEAIHTFQIHTLYSLNFKARVSLANLSQQKPQFATDYSVDVRINFNAKEIRLRDIAYISTNSRINIDVDQLLTPYKQDFNGNEAVLTFSLIPKKYRDKTHIETSSDELWFLFTAQDHYVEYYTDTGFSSGVLYQSGAFNYPLFSKEKSTLIQAPKIYKTKSINTYMSFIHNCFDDSHTGPAKLKLKLISPDQKAYNYEVEIPLKTVKLINLSSLIEGDYACAYALCTNASILPLTISHDHLNNTLAVEHSLPPNYYGAHITGPNRKMTIDQLKENIFNFAGTTL